MNQNYNIALVHYAYTNMTSVLFNFNAQQNANNLNAIIDGLDINANTDVSDLNQSVMTSVKLAHLQGHSRDGYTGAELASSEGADVRSVRRQRIVS